MAKFKKGNKLGGRTLGSKNKVSQDIRRAFQDLLENNIEKIAEDFKSIKEPEKRIKLYLELAQYCIPKLRSVEAEVNPRDVLIDFSINDLYKPVVSKEDIKAIAKEFKENY